MFKIICTIIGLISGTVTGTIVNNFAYGYCEIGEIVSWFSYICFGVPIIGGIVNGLVCGHMNDIYAEEIDFFSILLIIWEIVKLILKVAITGAAIAAAAFLIAFVRVFIESGGILAGIAVAVIISVCATPVIVIYIK